MDEPPLKLTVATVTYNAAPLLVRTMRSVAAQDYPHVEHIVIDGNSGDNTLELFHRYQERNSVAAVRHELNCLSEPDEGIYDAMNKALDLATGDYVLFLNAGDAFHSPTVLTAVAEAVSRAAVRRADGTTVLPGVVYGDTNIVDSAGRFLRPRRLSPPARLTWRSFRSGMLVCHQAFFASTALARSVRYDLRYRYSADFDWCIRIMRQARRERMPLVRVRAVVADYLNEGTTTRHHKASLRERFHIMRRHYGLLSTVVHHAWFVVRGIIRR